MKKGDILIIILLATFSLASAVPLFFRPEGSRVLVSENGVTLYEGSLRSDTVIETEHNRILIQGGHVRMIEADCPDQLCVKSGEATASHPVICLPNRLVITILTDKEEMDALSY